MSKNAIKIDIGGIYIDTTDFFFLNLKKLHPLDKMARPRSDQRTAHCCLLSATLLCLSFFLSFRQKNVSHEKLMKKISIFGISGKMFRWLRAFLSDRLQAVKVCDVLSDFINVTSGVPQGSVLGPVLFLMFINDLADVCENSVLKMFADDSKVYFKCRDETDFTKLLSDILNVLEGWKKIN